MAFVEYEEFDALGLAELVAGKKVQARELLSECLQRMDERNPALNAVIHRLDDYAQKRCAEELSGPFAGVPFVLKDLLAALAGHPMRSGARVYQDYVPTHNSVLVDRFLASGLVIAGKTSTPELGIAPSTEPELFGPTHNPWKRGHTPGGSSGGTAAAVAAGIVPMGSAGDGGGSIRIPASCCGLFGMKPSRGRNPQGPVETNLWGAGVCEHVISRSVRDSAAMLDAVAGPDAGAPYMLADPARSFLDSVSMEPGKLRIAVTTDPYLAKRVHPDCVDAVERAATLLSELGHEVIEDRAAIDGAEFGRCFLLMICSEVYASFRDAERDVGRKLRRDDFEEQSFVLDAVAQTFSAGELAVVNRSLSRMGREVAAFVEGYDAVLNPTLSLPPPAHGFLTPSLPDRVAQRLIRHGKKVGFGRVFHALEGPEKAAAEAYSFAGYSPIFNISGNPSMSVPLHWNDEGLPIGVMLTARLGAESLLFQLAGQLERAQPWFSRRPPRD